MLDTFQKLLPILCAGVLCMPGSARADVRMLSSASSGITISYRPDHFRADTLHVDNKVYIRYSADEHIASGAPGTPALPARTVLFAAPESGVPTLTVSAPSRSNRTGVTVAPNPSHYTDKSGIATEVFSEDPVRYALSGFQPGDYAQLGKRWTVDGISVWELTLRPVLFDAHAATAAVTDSFTVTVSWSGALAPVARPARIPEEVVNRENCIVPESLRALKPGAEITSPFATGDWYRIAVSDSGMYSITGSELAAKGFPVGSTPVNSVRMYYGGGLVLDMNPHEATADSFREIAVRVRDVNGDGYFSADDSIVFYGEALSRFIMSNEAPTRTFQNHPYATQNIYWVTISSAGTPKRMASLSEMPSDTLPLRTTFPEILHIESDVAQEYAESGILWYWYMLKGTASRAFSFHAPNMASGDTALVRVSFLNPEIILNNSQDEKRIAHDIEIYINKDGPFKHHIPFTEFSSAEIGIAGLLKEKGNLIEMRRASGGADETVQLDWVELEYERKLEMPGSELEFFYKGDGSPVRFAVSGVGRETVEVFDTSDPYTVTEISGKKYDAGGRTLTFRALPPQGKLGRFLLFDPGAYLKVSSITKKANTNLRSSRNGADYIVITHSLFLDEARKLADWRARDSTVDPLKTMTVNVADIYDEFGWGVLDPTSIRDFLRFSRDNYTPGVRYCCLVGDATNRFKNISASQTAHNYVPTFSQGDVTTDDFYTWDDITWSPRLAIGRLCVNTVEDAKTTVGKIIDYERSPEKGIWRDRVLLIADDETSYGGSGEERDFSEDTEYIDRSTFIPQYIERMKLMMIEYPMENLQKPKATEALIDLFDQGSLIATFIGHGNRDLLAHEHILVGARDIERFNNGGRLPLFIAASCEVGEFDRVGYTSLAEMLQLRKGGGCIAAIAASRKTWNYSNVEMVKSFYVNTFDTAGNPEARIGDALRKAKRSYSNDTIKEHNVNRYHIFGDPATRLAIPRNRFQVAPLDTLHQLEKVNITGNVTSGGKPVSYTGTLHIRAEGPLVHKRYKLPRGGLYIDYTMPGKVFFRGEIPIGGSGFASPLVVPKDLTSDTKESRIYLFAEGDAHDATGIIDKLAVGGIDPSAPEDTAGPEIKFAFDGKTFESGDYVRRQPTLTASLHDPSGLNIYGNRGHNVTLTLDKSEVTVLTGEVRNVGGFTTGLAEYTLPMLSPGEHQLEMNVYDSYNNVSKKTVAMHVVGSETGDIAIRDLLNYPNPMRTDGTTFTFNLTDDAGSAEIRIYSQSGRLVDKFKFSAEYGFNRIPWKPATEIANGVYFYKLTVHSQNGRKASRTEKMIVMR